MEDFDIRTVDGKSLTDIEDITIDETLKPEERVKQYKSQTSNPCMLKVGKVLVELSYEHNEVGFNSRYRRAILNAGSDL